MISLQVSVITVILFVGIVLCTNYDSPCSISDSESCNASLLLKCNQTNVAQFRCRCDPDQALESVITPRTCKPFPTQIGQPCDEVPDNEQGFCSKKIPGSLCNGTICVCDTDNYFQMPGPICVKYAETLGEDCFYTQQCIKIPGDGAFCDFQQTQKCVCPSSTHVPDGINGCYPIKPRLNESCIIPAQCETINNGTGVTCHPIRNTCECDTVLDYFTHPNGEECLKFLSALGDSCVPLSRQCERISPGAICNSTTATCGCDDGEYVTDSTSTTCLGYQRTLGGNCTLGTTPDHCLVLGGESECALNNQTCVCSSGYDTGIDNNSCFKTAQFVEDPCETQINCRNVPNTICPANTSTCICEAGFVPDGDRRSCIERTVYKLGDNCTTHEQCLGGIGANSTCGMDSRICECSTGFVELRGNETDRCLQRSSANGPCEHPIQCQDLGADADCLPSRVCGCLSGSGIYDDLCIRIISLGGLCTAHGECVLGANENAQCLPSQLPGAFTCQCSKETEPHAGSCHFVKQIYDPCSSHAECEVGITGPVFCTNGICTCALGYRPSFNNQTCTNNGYKITGEFSLLAVVVLLISNFSCF